MSKKSKATKKADKPKKAKTNNLNNRVVINEAAIELEGGYVSSD